MINSEGVGSAEKVWPDEWLWPEINHNSNDSILATP